MSYLSSKQVQDINSLYESIYSKVLSEEEQNNLLGIYFYNALVEDGLIDGEKINEGCDQESLNEVWSGIAGAVTKYGPKVMQGLRKVTGYGLGPSAGGKRKVFTAGTGTAAALDPQRAAEIVGGIVSGAANVAGGALKGGIEAATKDKKKPEQSQPNLDLTPQGTIRVR